jgi:hypothetical protein
MLVFRYAQEWHLIWSDGCGSQFKISKPWFFVSKYFNINNGYKMIWFFFGCGHGKGPHDGARTIIKRFLKRKQLNVHGEKLQNAKEVVTFLKKHLFDTPNTSYASVNKLIKRFFWHIKSDDVIRNNYSFNCNHDKGCIKLHSIFASHKHNLTQLLVKDLACYCIFCLDHKWGDCENLQWSGSWTSKHLQPSYTKAVLKKMIFNWVGEPNYTPNANGFTTTLDVGDNFVVNAKIGNSKGMNFWTIYCSRPLHCVQKTFKDKWGTYFELGDYVVVGLHYQRWGTNEHSYVLLKDSHLVYLHYNFVHVIKFLMSSNNYKISGNPFVYKLSDDFLNGIKYVIVGLDDD